MFQLSREGLNLGRDGPQGSPGPMVRPMAPAPCMVRPMARPMAPAPWAPGHFIWPMAPGWSVGQTVGRSVGCSFFVPFTALLLTCDSRSGSLGLHLLVTCIESCAQGQHPTPLHTVQALAKDEIGPRGGTPQNRKMLGF